MEINFTGKYKSLSDFNWSDIPKLAIISGPNGSGKTQLLEMIHTTLSPPSGFISSSKTWNLKIGGDLIEKDDVIFLKGDWGVTNITPVGIAALQNKIQLIENLYLRKKFLMELRVTLKKAVEMM